MSACCDSSREDLKIRNVNSKTAEICRAVGEYLIELGQLQWIDSLALTVDGKEYKAEGGFEEDGELYAVCKTLAAAKEVHMALQTSDNIDHAINRINDFSREHGEDDPETRQNVTYRCIADWDTDPGVEMFRYDENGLKSLFDQSLDYTQPAECVADIEEWYCYTPEICIDVGQEQKKNADLRERVMAIITKLCALLGYADEQMEEIDSQWKELEEQDEDDDDWEGLMGFDDDEMDHDIMLLEYSVRFATKDIPAIVELANQLVALLKEFDSAVTEFGIYAIPDGENDYKFASVALELKDSAVVDSYCRF